MSGLTVVGTTVCDLNKASKLWFFSIVFLEANFLLDLISALSSIVEDLIPCDQ